MKIKAILIIILSIIISNSSVFAQQFFYKPDTVNQFKVYGVDTLPNFLERKTVYSYEKDNSIKSKEEYIWNPMELKFRYINSYRFAKYPNEINAIEFIIDNNNLEKEKYKTSYLLNKSKKIKEINQTYSQGNETKLWRSTVYSYNKKDSLQKIEFFKSSTTFFKEKMIELKYEKNKIFQTTSYFDEIDYSKNFKLQEEINFENGLIAEKKTIGILKSNFDTVIKFTYNVIGNLITDTSFIVLKNDKDKRKQYIKATNYFYNKDNNLVSKIIYYLNSNGSVENKKQSIYYVYQYKDSNNRKEKLNYLEHFIQ